jgi:hypothetical protein
MHPIISSLDDRSAIRILDRVLTGIHDHVRPSLELTPELSHALAVQSGLPSGTGCKPGDLARATLEFLSADPDIQPQILALALDTEPQKFDGGIISGIVVLTLALCALQIEAEVAYDAKNGLSVRLKKRAASDALLKQFLAKIGSFLANKPEGKR